MKKINRSVFFSVLVVLAYVLSACSGAPAGQSSNDQSSQSGQVQEVVFTGTVDSMGGGEWTISGQAVSVDGTTSVDANIAVGNNVKVEARVGQDGKVIAVRVELAGADDANTNSNDDNQNDGNANDNAASNSNDNQGDNSNSNADNGNDDNSNGNGNDNSSDGVQQEVSGVVEAIATDAITISGVAYMIADFTEFKDIIAVGDQVKAHVLVNPDGTFTIIEIEKIDGTGLDNGNSNSNDNGSDDNSNGNVSNGNDNNSNDDNNNGNDNNSNDNGNDDNGNDDNDNDDNDNDDNGNDDNSNSNGNG